MLAKTDAERIVYIMRVPQESIESLVSEALNSIDPLEMFDRATKNVDLEAMQNAEPPISNIDFATTYAVAGYALGVRDALENIELTEETEPNTVEIKLTPTKLEQLRVIRKYDRGLFESERDIEEIARELFYDAVRAKYNFYREKYGEEI